MHLGQHLDPGSSVSLMEPPHHAMDREMLEITRHHTCTPKAVHPLCASAIKSECLLVTVLKEVRGCTETCTFLEARGKEAIQNCSESFQSLLVQAMIPK